MQKYWLILHCLLLGSAFAYSPNTPNGVIAENGSLKAAPLHKILLKDNFNIDGPAWEKAKNFKNFVTIERKVMKEKDSLHFSCQSTDPRADSAFEIFTKPFNVIKPETYTISFDAYANMHTSGFKGFRGNFQNRICFYDKDGKIISQHLFSFVAGRDDFRKTVIAGVFPEGTRSFTFHLGSDSPNLRQKARQFFALRNLTIKVFDSGAPWAEISEFTSPAFAIGTDKTLSWKAQGKVLFQIATAPEINGFPGKFSAFCGPDGSDGSWFEQNGSALPTLPEKAKYIRYRARMISTTTVPTMLQEVSIAGNKDCNWDTTVDSVSPVVERISASPVEDASQPLVIKITDDSGVDWESLRLTLDNKKKAPLAKLTDKGVVIAPVKQFKRGLHSIKVSVADYNGNKTEKIVFFFIGKKAEKGIVTLRDDGIMLIDGQPFFPIGLYNFSKQKFNNNNLDKGLEVLKEAGFNYVCHWPTYRNANFAEYLAAVKKHGFKINLGSGEGSNDADLERAAWYLAAERLNPNMIMWYIADDTANNANPAQLQERTAMAKAIAPHLVTGQADAPFWNGASRYRKYATATKVFLPELYPVREDNQKDRESSVASVIRDMREINKDIAITGAAPVSVWPIIQYFKGYRTWKRFPTRDELWAMSYASIINGASGITWYTYRTTEEKGNYGVTSTPERWNNMRTLALELKSLTPILVSRDAAEKTFVEVIAGPKLDAYKGASITARTKEYSNKKYIFAVNSTLKEVTAEFSVRNAVKGKHMKSCAPLKISKGKFTEKFAPYEVKIMVIE